VVIPPPPVPTALPRRAPPSERVARLRFGFAKTGSLALISHLDTLRLLERALRRTGLPVSFTGGFHPLPRLQLALALPLGVEGLGEWLDLEFIEAVQPQEVRQRLQAELPAEFQLLSALEVPLQGQSLALELQEAHWAFELRPDPAGDPALLPAGSVAWQQAVDALLASDELPWSDTDKKGRPRQRDCRPSLLALRLEQPGAGDASIGAVRVALEAEIDPQGRSIRPAQISHWLGERLGINLAVARQQRRALLLGAC
jgi:radical SAM-linked protein